jgi:hypothetical protein
MQCGGIKSVKYRIRNEYENWRSGAVSKDGSRSWKKRELSRDGTRNTKWEKQWKIRQGMKVRDECSKTTVWEEMSRTSLNTSMWRNWGRRSSWSKTSVKLHQQVNGWELLVCGGVVMFKNRVRWRASSRWVRRRCVDEKYSWKSRGSINSREKAPKNGSCINWPIQINWWAKCKTWEAGGLFTQWVVVSLMPRSRWAIRKLDRTEQ